MKIVTEALKSIALYTISYSRVKLYRFDPMFNIQSEITLLLNIVGGLMCKEKEIEIE